MSTVNNTNSATGSSVLDQYAIKNNTTKPSNDMGQQQFMTLMLTQLKNQDPLSPMDNAQFLSQLAQFNTATGVQDLKSSFSQLSQSLNSNQALQASTLVGRSVLVPSQSGVLASGGTLDGNISLPASTNSLMLNFYDASGTLVRQAPMGPHTSGTVDFSWDGKDDNGSQLPAGVYGVKATAMIDGKQQALNTNVAAHVDSVTIGQSGAAPMLNLAGIGSLDFSKVKQIM